MNKLILLTLTAVLSTAALAKLPAASDEAKAKAAEAAAKTAWAGKVDGYQLCKAQDQVAAKVKKTAAVAKGAKPAPSACVDPGPFVYTPAAVAAPASAAAAPAAPAAAKKP